MLRLLQGIALVGGTMTIGLMAGVFGLYSHTVMPGLGRTDDRTFVGAFQSMDRAILNPWFLPVFLGGVALTGLAVALCLGDDTSPVLPWVAAALVLYLVAFAVTMAVNVPINDQLKAAGDPDTIADLAAARSQFDEARWASWNLVRTLTSTVAFGAMAGALLQFGRVLGSSGS
jgi:uncharacterized membrane protein